MHLGTFLHAQILLGVSLEHENIRRFQMDIIEIKPGLQLIAIQELKVL